MCFTLTVLVYVHVILKDPDQTFTLNSCKWFCVYWQLPYFMSRIMKLIETRNLSCGYVMYCIRPSYNPILIISFMPYRFSFCHFHGSNLFYSNLLNLFSSVRQLSNTIKHHGLIWVSKIVL